MSHTSTQEIWITSSDADTHLKHREMKPTVRTCPTSKNSVRLPRWRNEDKRKHKILWNSIWRLQTEASAAKLDTNVWTEPACGIFKNHLEHFSKLYYRNINSFVKKKIKIKTPINKLWNLFPSKSLKQF